MQCFRDSVLRWRAGRIGGLACLVTILAALPTVPRAQREGVVDGPTTEARRLSRIFFGVASTLEGGTSTVGLLRSRVSLRDPTLESSMDQLNGRYGEYVSAVGRFKSSVSGLLDRPTDRSLLFRVLMDGHQSCWRLDVYTRLVETFGVSGRDLMSILSSTEACDRFRRTAFDPGVEGLIQDALANGETWRRELETLREEHGELEQLLEDLRRIDESD